jgi:uncharacterized UBP type Zn finger protein
MDNADKKICAHMDQIKDVMSNTPDGCEECLKLGDTWVQLRMCLSCGHVGCCDSSKNKHATKHFMETKHPIMQSYKSDNKWKWCYVDEIYL